MPLFEYRCKNKMCENSKGFEKLHFKIKDTKLTKCPICNALLEQLISSPNVHFKGSGFHVVDYPKEKIQTDKKAIRKADEEKS